MGRKKSTPQRNFDRRKGLIGETVAKTSTGGAVETAEKFIAVATFEDGTCTPPPPAEEPIEMTTPKPKRRKPHRPFSAALEKDPLKDIQVFWGDQREEDLESDLIVCGRVGLNVNVPQLKVLTMHLYRDEKQTWNLFVSFFANEEKTEVDEIVTRYVSLPRHLDGVWEHIYDDHYHHKGGGVFTLRFLAKAGRLPPLSHSLTGSSCTLEICLTPMAFGGTFSDRPLNERIGNRLLAVVSTLNPNHLPSEVSIGERKTEVVESVPTVVAETSDTIVISPATVATASAVLNDAHNDASSRTLSDTNPPIASSVIDMQENLPPMDGKDRDDEADIAALGDALGSKRALAILDSLTRGDEEDAQTRPIEGVHPLPGRLRAVIANRMVYSPYDYQLYAVQHMIRLERRDLDVSDHDNDLIWQRIPLHPPPAEASAESWPRASSPPSGVSGDALFVNRCTGALRKVYPPDSAAMPPSAGVDAHPLPPTVGVLADEMGLGKTYEVLAHIIASQDTDNDMGGAENSHRSSDSGNTQLLNALSSSSSSFSSSSSSSSSLLLPAPSPSEVCLATSKAKYFHGLSPGSLACMCGRKRPKRSGTTPPLNDDRPSSTEGDSNCELSVGSDNGDDNVDLEAEDAPCKPADSPHGEHRAAGATLTVERSPNSGDSRSKSNPKRASSSSSGCRTRRKSGAEDPTPLVACAECHLRHHAVCVSLLGGSVGEQGGWVCPRCEAQTVRSAGGAAASAVSGATILVVPAAILSQWQRELKKHVKNVAISYPRSSEREKSAAATSAHMSAASRPFKATVVPGTAEAVKDGSPEAIATLSPKYLSEHDLVLISFERLQKEYHFWQAHEAQRVRGGGSESGGESRGRRKRSRSQRPTPPASAVMCVHWRRVTLDEAQRVESFRTLVAHVARSLVAPHRWAVSGTPMGRDNLGDLLGLNTFLGRAPFHEPRVWNKIVRDPLNLVGSPRRGARRGGGASNLARAAAHPTREEREAAAVAQAETLLRTWLRRFVIRRTHAQVETGLPQQVRVKRELKQSDLEAFHYGQRQQIIQKEAREVMEKCRKHNEDPWDPVLSLTNQLRLACDHFQLGRRKKRRRKRASKQKRKRGGAEDSGERLGECRVMTEKECYQAMWEEERVKAEEALRILNMEEAAKANLLLLRARRIEMVLEESAVDVCFEHTIHDIVEEDEKINESINDGKNGETKDILPKDAALRCYKLRQLADKVLCRVLKRVQDLRYGEMSGAVPIARDNVSMPTGSLVNVTPAKQSVNEIATRTSSTKTMLSAEASASLSVWSVPPPMPAAMQTSNHALDIDFSTTTVSGSVFFKLPQKLRLVGMRLHIKSIHLVLPQECSSLSLKGRLTPSGQEALQHGDALCFTLEVPRITTAASATLSPLHAMADVTDVDTIAAVRQSISVNQTPLSFGGAVLSAQCVNMHNTEEWRLMLSVCDAEMLYPLRIDWSITVELLESEVAVDRMQLLALLSQRLTICEKLQSNGLLTSSQPLEQNKENADGGGGGGGGGDSDRSSSSSSSSSNNDYYDQHEAAGQQQRNILLQAEMSRRQRRGEIGSSNIVMVPTLLITMPVNILTDDVHEIQQIMDKVQQDYIEQRMIDRKISQAKLGLKSDMIAQALSEQISENSAWRQIVHESIKTDRGPELLRILQLEARNANIDPLNFESSSRSDGELYDQARTAIGATGIPHFNTLESFVGILQRHLEMAIGHRAELINTIQGFPDQPSKSVLQKNLSCGICRQDWNMTGAPCHLCQLNGKVEAYCDAFIWVGNRGGSNFYTAATKTLMAILRFARSQSSCDSFRTLANKMAQGMRVTWGESQGAAAQSTDLRVEVFRMRRVNDLEMHNFSACSELNQAMTPLTLAGDASKGAVVVEQQDKRHYVGHYELGHRSVKNHREIPLHRDEFMNAKSRKRFLSTLSGDNKCAICLSEDVKESVVWPCGHSSCVDCAGTWRKKFNGQIKCFYCKQTFKQEPRVVSHLNGENGSEAARAAKVKGSWGTKVKAILADLLSEIEEVDKKRAAEVGACENDRCGKGNGPVSFALSSSASSTSPTLSSSMISPLSEGTPHLKVIIFSQWEEMLDIIEVALQRNSIKSFRGKGQGKDFNAGVEAFKEEADEHVALLLNIKQGGQGLTLNEATHMFLADPLLSDAQRAQVISRIHRVGQTRETTVHDYVTVKTVEEAIDKHLGVSSSSLSQFTASSAHGTRLTIKDLMTLLFPKNDWS